MGQSKLPQITEALYAFSGKWKSRQQPLRSRYPEEMEALLDEMADVLGIRKGKEGNISTRAILESIN